MSKEETATATEVPDGRRLRSERSRNAIIEAMVDLMEEDILVPTAQQVADQAGVGIRSVFRHFSDMESLFATVDAQSRENYESLFLGGDRDGTLEERIEHAVERHADAYETLKNTFLMTHAQMWRYEVLRKNYARYQRGLRRDLDDWLPELKAMQKPWREALDAVASFEMWHRLREHQKLSKKQSIEVVVAIIKGIVSDF